MKKFFIAILSVLLLGATCNLASAQSVKELENQRKATLRQLDATAKLLNETKKNEKASMNKLNILSRSVAERKKLIKDVNAEILALDAEQVLLQQQHASLEEQLHNLKVDYARLVQETHYSQNKYGELMFLLSAESFEQMYRRLRYLQQFTEYRKHQVNQIVAIQADISTKNEQLQQNKKSKQDVLQLRERERENLARDERRAQLMLNELKKKEKDLLAQQKKQQKKADELNNRIEKLIAEEIRKSEAAKKKVAANKSTTGGTTSQTTSTTLTKEETLIAGGFEQNKGRLPWPTENGFVSGKYGMQPDPVWKHVTVNNKGIYIQTTVGTDARAVFEGVVTQRFTVPGSTNAVIVKHGNYRTVYANLTEIYVKEGDKVKAKQKIGKIYTDTDNDNKTELYFQVRKDAALENPSLWLSK